MEILLAFHIETACTEESPNGDLNALRPLGITCATAIAQDITEPFVWHGKTTSGEPSAKMTRDEAAQLVRDLQELVAKGYTIVTWNGVGFDFDILGEESGLYAECTQLATDHVDMFFHVLCTLGHYVGLQNAAEGMGLPGKTDGMCGLEAPKKWAAGRHQVVIDYCVQDVRVTLNLALECTKQRKFQWLSKQGKIRKFPFTDGWLTVQEAMQLQEPGTSWMTDPPKRSKIVGWIDKAFLGAKI